MGQISRRSILALLGLAPAVAVVAKLPPAPVTPKMQPIFEATDGIYNGVIIRETESIDNFGTRMWIDWARDAVGCRVSTKGEQLTFDFIEPEDFYIQSDDPWLDDSYSDDMDADDDADF